MGLSWEGKVEGQLYERPVPTNKKGSMTKIGCLAKGGGRTVRGYLSLKTAGDAAPLLFQLSPRMLGQGGKNVPGKKKSGFSFGAERKKTERGTNEI